MQKDAINKSDRLVECGDVPAQAPTWTPSHRTHPQWYALYTWSHREQLVYDQLTGRGFTALLPKMDIWSRRGGIQHRISIPMFPSYLFLHHFMDKVSYIEICKARGLVRILGKGWDRLSVVPDDEIDAIQRVLHAKVPVIPYSYFREGQRVRITHGPLTGVEGVLVQSKPNKGLLVLSIELLCRSIAVKVDSTLVSAA